MSAPNPTDELTSPHDEFAFEPPPAPRSFPRPWERIPQKSIAPQLRGRKIWKRYNLRDQQRASSVNDEEGARSQRSDKRTLHSTKRRRLCDPFAGLGKQSPSKPMPYVPSFQENQDTMLQRKYEPKTSTNSPTTSSKRSPTKSPKKGSQIHRSPSRRKSPRASSLRERRHTTSPLKRNLVQAGNTLEIGQAISFEGAGLLGLADALKGGLAGDASRSLLSRRRSVTLLGRDEPVAPGSDAPSIVGLDAVLEQFVPGGPQDLGQSLADAVNQVEQHARPVPKSAAATERESDHTLDSLGAASRDLESSSREIRQEVLPAEAASTAEATPEDAASPEQTQLAQLPFVLDSLESPESPLLKALHDGLEQSTTIARRSNINTDLAQSSVAPLMALPELPTSTLEDPLEMMPIDLLETELLEPTSECRSLGEEVDGNLHPQDSVCYDGAPASDESSSDLEHLDEEPSTSVGHEVRIGKALANEHQVLYQVANDKSDAWVATSTDSQLITVDQPSTGIDHELVNDIQQGKDVLEEDNDAATTHIRPRTRVSDETVMLKDFLSRAQARRAVVKPTDTVVSSPKTPPRKRKRSKRKALQPLNTNSPSPTKPAHLADHGATSPIIRDENVQAEDDVCHITPAPTSPRRSTRTRLVAPSKSPVGVPSLIPVRRADGTDPVVLQKSANQELSMATRANTRRNKGRARLPKLMLAELAEAAEKEGGGIANERTESIGPRAQTAIKFVRWDEKRLVQYQEASADATEGEDAKRAPKMRRLRGLGATNGTPAPKRVHRDLLRAASSSIAMKPSKSRGQSEGLGLEQGGSTNDPSRSEAAHDLGCSETQG